MLFNLVICNDHIHVVRIFGPSRYMTIGSELEMEIDLDGHFQGAFRSLTIDPTPCRLGFFRV